MSLCLRRIERRAYPGDSVSARDPDLRPYLADIAAPYGFGLRDDLLDAGRGHSYGEMAERIAQEVTGEGAWPDLVVLAHAMPDVIPGRATATYLSHLFPGDPPSFAICDQGTAAAFSALTVTREYLRTGDRRRALVLFVEQSALHIVAPAPTPAVPERHAAVALLLERDGEARLSPAVQRAGIAPDDVPAILAREVEGLSDGRSDVTVLLGAELAARTSLPGAVRAAPSGQPFTGPWWELARLFAEPGAAGRVIVADYEPMLRYLCLLPLDLPCSAVTP